MSSKIPDSVKENVRAVLLSKTDGSGVLVSTFLRDYKSFIREPLAYKNMGYPTLEAFIKDIPDVCRLEYSDSHMAFKLFGITKPNTFVSSFVKRAQNGDDDAEDKEDRRRIRGSRGSGSSGGGRRDKEDRFTPSQSLDEDWIPNHRGLYTLCFPNLPGNGLETKEAVALKFTQLGEVAEINMIAKMTFVRFSEQSAAKMALKTWGSDLRLRRAEEKKLGNCANPMQSEQGVNMSERNRDSPRQNTGALGGRRKHNSNENDSNKRQDFAQRGENSAVENDSGAGGRWGKPKPDSSTLPTDKENNSSEVIQVYVGNWPNTASEKDLLDLIQPFRHLGCRIKTSKQSSTKQYAFVDFNSVADAKHLIEQLNHYTFLSRQLQVRFANRALETAQTNGELNDDTSRHKAPAVESKSKGSIEEEFEKMAVHKSSEPGSYVPRNQPISRTINNNKFSPEAKNPPPTSYPASPQQMPPLEKFYSPQMPKLERDLDGHRSGNMSPLVNFNSPQMPKLERETGRYYSGKMNFSENFDLPQMPKRERDVGPYYGGGDAPDDMPKLEKTMVSPTSNHTEGGSVQLFLGNFPYGTSERELFHLFAPYGIQNIAIMNQNVTNRSTYAFATVNDLANAQMAILTLDQSLFRNRRLTVTMASPVTAQVPLLQGDSQASNHLARITCTVGGNAERTVSLGDTSLSQISPISRTNISVMSGEGSISNIAVYSKSQDGFNFKRMTTTLKDYSMIVSKLRGEDQFDLPPGLILKVLITHVENDKYFWGQILMDSQRGMWTNLQRLDRLTSELQAPESKTKELTGLGRCAAKFEGEWYRAWCSHTSEIDGIDIGDVLYVDYGNTAKVPRNELFHTQGDIWNIPPICKPFKLAEVHMDLQKFADKVVEMKVVETGTCKLNYMTTVQIKYEQ